MTGTLNSNPSKYRYSRIAYCAYKACGRLFKVPTDRSGQLYCSWECWRAARARSHISVCSLRSCGASFDNGGDFDKKFCSDACRKAALALNRLPPTPSECLICDCDTGKPNRLYCSDECRAEARRRRSNPKSKKKRYKGRVRGTARPQDLTLYARVLDVGTKAAGKEIGKSKSAVNGLLFRAGLSSRGAPRAQHRREGSWAGRKSKSTTGSSTPSALPKKASASAPPTFTT